MLNDFMLLGEIKRLFVINCLLVKIKFVNYLTVFLMRLYMTYILLDHLEQYDW